jgi:hypothetical protein
VTRAASLTALCVALAGPAGCSSGSGGSGAPGDAGAPASLASLAISTGDLRPPFDPNVTDYDVTALDSVYPVAVTATAATPATALTIHGAPAKSGAASTFTLHPREDVHVVASAPGRASTTYTIHYVPSDFPTYETSRDAGAGSEDVLLTANGEYLLMVDRSGAPLYYRTFLPNDVENFQQTTLPGGQVEYEVGVGVYNAQGWTLGAYHVMDQQFRDVADYQLLAHAAHGVLPAEGHEFRMLDDAHYVAMSYVQRTLDLSAYGATWSKQALVMSAVMQEVDHGQVLVEWDSANVPSLYSDSTYGNDFASTALQDYLHMNSIDIDPADGNFVVSFRHTSSIVKIDRHSAQILWTLGGKEDQFGLTADQRFSFQHHVRIQADGSMTVFDDGNGLHQSRVVSLVLDEAAHAVKGFQVLYTKPASQPATGLMGSAFPLSGGRLFCGWGGWYSSELAPAATEIAGGSVVWSFEFTMPGVFSYRAMPVADEVPAP